MNQDELRQLKLIRKEAERIAKFYGNIQVGSGTTDAAGDATVTFPGGFTFSSTPKVFLQGVDAAAKGIVLDVVSKTVAGFTVKARKVTGLPTGTALKGIHYTKDYGLINVGYTTASAVTGIPNITGYGGPDHTHGFSGTTGAASAYVSPVNVIADHDPTSGPSTPHTTVASSTHTHTNPKTYANIDPGIGSPYTGTVYHAWIGSLGTIYRHSYSESLTVNEVTHKHNQPATGSPSTTTTVASSTHTHTVSAHVGTRVDAASRTHTHDYSGTTGGASAYSHRHSIGSPSTASFVDSLFIPAPPDPTYWKEFVTSLSIWDPDDLITVVVGGAPVLAADFDWLALLS